MKLLKNIVIGLLVFFILFIVGAYILIKTFDINKYRAPITAQISKQIGRAVLVDGLELKFSLLKGIYAQVKGLKIEEDAEYGHGNFLTINSIQVDVDLPAYLSRKEIIVNRIVVSGLDLTVIRNSQGQMNVQKIGPVGTQTAAAPAPSAAAEDVTLPDFAIQSIVLENGTIKFIDQSLNPPFSLTLEKVAAQAVANSKDLEVQSFSAYLSTGMISGTAKITDYMKSMNLTTQVKINALPLEAIVKNLPEGMNLKGGANAELTLSANGLSNPDVFLSSLNGSGRFDVNDGKIENFNILKMILSRIELIPGLVEAVESSIPEKYRQDFMSDETVFEKIGSSIQINGGSVNIPDLVVLSKLFAANLQIKTDSKLNGKVSGQLKLPEDLSQALAAQAEVLQYLRGSDGQITISLTSFEGPLASMKILPDMKELSKVAIQNEGKRQIGKLLDKVLDQGDGQAQQGEGASAGEEIIGGVLDKIFK